MGNDKNVDIIPGSPLGAGGLRGFIIVTGAAGFIASCMVQYLNDSGYTNLILVDDFGVEEKRKNCRLY